MNVSEHFTLKEMTHSHIATRQGIRNEPHDGDVIINLRALAEHILEPVRFYTSTAFSPNSAYRCPILNNFVGSKPSSQHLKGQAVDFEVPGFSNKELAEWIRDNLDFDQLILEFFKEGDPTSGWIHCSYIDDPDKLGLNRQMSLIYDGKNYTKF